jgi:hypothetical protein
LSEEQSRIVTLATILADVIILAKERWRLLLAVTLTNTVLDTWSEWALSPLAKDFTSILLIPLSVYLSTVIACAALKDVRLLPGSTRKWKLAALVFPAVFLQSAIMAVGVIAGLMLLIVPGLVLIVRWSPALPILIVEKKGVWPALEKSWQMTAGCGVLIAELVCISIVLFLPTIVATIWYPVESGRSLPLILGDYIFFHSASVLMTLAAVPLHRQLKRETQAAPLTV